MSASRLSRRGFLRGAAGVALAAGLAGCSARASASLEPHLPAERLDATGWRFVDDVHETAAETVHLAGRRQRVDAEVRADVYRNDAPTRRVAEGLGVEPDDAVVPAEAFVAAKARVDPPVTRLFGLSPALLARAADAAEAEAIRALEAEGFEDVRRVSSGRLDVEAGPTATHRVYRGTYPYEAFEVEHEGRPVTVEAGAIDVEAQLAAWPAGGLLVAAAGVYPGAPAEVVVRADGWRQAVPLAFEPAAYREDVRGLITHVS